MTLKLLEHSKARCYDDDDARKYLEEANMKAAVGEDCDADRCLKIYASTLECSYVVKGEMSREGDGRIMVIAQLVGYDAGELAKEAMFNFKMYATEYEWYAEQTALKLINKSYTIEKAPADAGVKVRIEVADPGKINVDTAGDLKKIVIKSQSTIINRIDGVLRKWIREGDNSLNNHNFTPAKKSYKKVIYKIDKEVPSRYRASFSEMRTLVKKRIAKADSGKVKSRLLEGDQALKEKKFDRAIDIYDDANTYYRSQPLSQRKIMQLQYIINKRIKNVELGRIRKIIKTGDTYYNDYQFDKAVGQYENAYFACTNSSLYTASKKDSDIVKLYNEVKEKRKRAKNTGYKVFKNKVFNYLDHITILKLEEKPVSSKISEMKSFMRNKFFCDYRTGELAKYYDEVMQITGNNETLKSMNCRSWQAGSFGPGSSAGERKVITVKGVEFAFRWCPPTGPQGFMMGSPSSEKDRRDNERQHKVILSKGFWMMENEVTIEQFKVFLEDTGISSGVDYDDDDCPLKKNGNLSYNKFGKDKKQPMVEIDWNVSQRFCKWLGEKAGISGNLPTEAQWEYACRAGSKTAYSFGESSSSLDEYAWYYGNSSRKTHVVKSKKSNAWGLYDMHGNVWEWCLDWYGDYPSGTVTDPRGVSSGSYRVLRGGGWGVSGLYCRSAFRNRNRPSSTRDNNGLRACLSPGQ